MGSFQLKKWEPYYGFILLVLGIIFYIPFLGSVHLFDWDEINFAESSREMLVTGNYFRVMVDYQPFWEKPPLFFWLQCLSMKLFGINEMAARLPNAIFGILTLLTIFQSGKRIKNAFFGFIWAFIYLISFLPFFYFKSGIIDPVFNYFIFSGMLLLIRSCNSGSVKTKMGFSFAAGLLNGLAVLTKGPVGFLLLFLTILIVWISSGFKKGISFKSFLVFVAGMIITSSLWYLPELINNGPWFLQEFITYQVELFTKPVAGHRQPFYYHFLVVFLGCFPLSVFALPQLFAKHTDDEQLKMHKKWNLILFWTVMILFSIVKTKIVHYSSMAYLPLSFIAAKFIYQAIEQKKSVGKLSMILIGTIGGVFSLILLLVPYFFMHRDFFTPYIKDPFALAVVRQEFNWSGIEYIFGGLFLVSLIMLLVFMARKEMLKGLLIYGITSLLVFILYLKMVVPKVEKYVQGGVIEFYESMQGKDVYVIPSGFKTYAHLFYFRQPYYNNIYHGQERRILLTEGVIDKTVYVVVKCTDTHISHLPGMELVKQTGGYIIYKREPSL
jgi:hypothetical protein